MNDEQKAILIGLLITGFVISIFAIWISNPDTFPSSRASFIIVIYSVAIIGIIFFSIGAYYLFKQTLEYELDFDGVVALGVAFTLSIIVAGVIMLVVANIESQSAYMLKHW